MNREEALIYLPAQDDDERDDLYEDKLFECKQFFINRFPIGKVIKSRISKLLKLEEAYIALGGIVKPFSVTERQDFPKFQSIQHAFSWYHSQRNALKLNLNGAQSAREIEEILTLILEVTKRYAQEWELELLATDPLAISSQEPDPMELQAAFKQFENGEQISRACLAELADDQLLKMEAKRLSRWLKSEE